MSVFGAVVRQGNFARAAKQLGMTASGVSRRISRFELRLGVRLFNRTTRQMSLTDAGEALATRCEDILEAISEAEEVAIRLGATPSGTLRVAASNAFSVFVVLPLLRRLREKYPDLHVVIVQGDGPIDILQRNADLAISPELPGGESFIARKLIEDPWVICAAPEYLERHGAPTTPEDLFNHDCLTIHASDRTRDRWSFRNPDGSDARSLPIEGVVSGIGLVVREAVLAGLGIGCIARLIVQSDLKAGRLVPLLEAYMPENTRSIYAIYPSRTHLSAKVRVFLDELVEYVQYAAHHGLDRSDVA